MERAEAVEEGPFFEACKAGRRDVVEELLQSFPRLKDALLHPSQKDVPSTDFLAFLRCRRRPSSWYFFPKK